MQGRRNVFSLEQIYYRGRVYLLKRACDILLFNVCLKIRGIQEVMLVGSDLSKYDHISSLQGPCFIRVTISRTIDSKRRIVY